MIRASVWLSIICSGLTACTVIEDTDRSGFYIGVVVLNGEETERAPLTKDKQIVLGFWSDTDPSRINGSTGMGWRSSNIVKVTNECRIVFLINDFKEATEAATLLQDEFQGGTEICIEQPEQG